MIRFTSKLICAMSLLYTGLNLQATEQVPQVDSPLMKAIWKGDVSGVSQELKTSSIFDKTLSKSGVDAVEYALKHMSWGSKSQHAEKVKALILNHIDPATGDNAFMRAIKEWDLKQIQRLSAEPTVDFASPQLLELYTPEFFRLLWNVDIKTMRAEEISFLLPHTSLKREEFPLYVQSLVLQLSPAEQRKLLFLFVVEKDLFSLLLAAPAGAHFQNADGIDAPARDNLAYMEQGYLESRKDKLDKIKTAIESLEASLDDEGDEVMKNLLVKLAQEKATKEEKIAVYSFFWGQE